MAITDYKRIEYIEVQKIGSTYSYIDLGSSLRPNRYWTVGGQFTLPVTGVSSTIYLFGVNDGTRNYTFMYSGGDSCYKFRYANQTAVSLSPVHIFPDNQIVGAGWYYDYNSSKAIGYIYDEPDEEYSSSGESSSSGTQLATKNFYIVCRNNNGTPGGYFEGARIYELTMYDEQNLQSMAFFVPVREKTGVDPKVGLYDTVSDTVFWSKTTTNFLAGPDLNSTEVNVKVNGAWYSGTPYIKVNGSWEEATDVYIKVNGNWESAV